MIAGIFYPILTVYQRVLYEKKQNFLGALHPRLHQGITLDPLGSLQHPPRHPAAIFFGFAKHLCAHIFSVLFPVNMIILGTNSAYSK